jgi:hypothetical protein
MPRRKPKHLFSPGESGNPNGRPPGSVNEINKEIKWAFTQLLRNQLPNLEEWLTRAAQKDPMKAADLMLRVSERFLPSLQRTEITGPEGQAFTPITINIPNITFGEGASANISDSQGQGLSLGEGAPTINLPGHLEHLDSAVSGETLEPTQRDGHYEHLDSAVFIPESPAEAPSQEIPDTEEHLENSPIFAPEIDIPMRQEDQFDPAQVKIAYEEWKAKQNKPL